MRLFKTKTAFGMVGVFLGVIILNFALLAGAVWVVIKVCQAAGVL